MRIKATFLDEISHDIPHQNWGATEWDADFASMKAIGIEMVVLIRSGYKRWQTFPSEVLSNEEKCYNPPVNLVKLFLELSDKYVMQFILGCTIRDDIGLIPISGQMAIMNAKL